MIKKFISVTSHALDPSSPCHKLSHLLGTLPLECDVLYGRPLSPFQVVRPITEKERVCIVAERTNGPSKLPWTEDRSVRRPAQEERGRPAELAQMYQQKGCI